MARITKDYANHNKEELLAEINARKIEGGHTMATHKEDMIAALALDDEEKATAPDPVKPTETKAPEPAKQTPAEIAAPKVHAPVPSNIPDVALPKTDAVRVFNQPPPHELYKGEYVELSTQEPYALAVLDKSQVENDKTHFLKNRVHFHQLTEAEFRAQFEKK